jgi:hypothetical protein
MQLVRENLPSPAPTLPSSLRSRLCFFSTLPCRSCRRRRRQGTELHLHLRLCRHRQRPVHSTNARGSCISSAPTGRPSHRCGSCDKKVDVSSCLVCEEKVGDESAMDVSASLSPALMSRSSTRLIARLVMELRTITPRTPATRRRAREGCLLATLVIS